MCNRKYTCRIAAFLMMWSVILFACSEIETGDNLEQNTVRGEATPASLEESDRPQLILDTGDGDGALVKLDFVNAIDKNGPRVAEIFARYSSNLKYESVETGKAVSEAQKQLVVQEIEQGKLRIVVLAADNTNELDTGTLCTLKFNKTNDEKARVEILTEQPIFAPDEANEGLLVGDPVEF